MLARILYFSAIVTGLGCLALIPSVFAQRSSEIGASPQSAIPEIARQMKRQAVDNFTAAELREFAKLRDADADIIRRLVTQSKTQIDRIADLERYVSTLDVSVNARELALTTAAVSRLEGKAKAAEELATQERRDNHDLLVKVALIGLATLLGGCMSWLNRHWAEKRRKTDKETAQLALYKKLAEVREDSRNAIDAANHVNEKIYSLGIKLGDGQPLSAGSAR